MSKEREAYEIYHDYCLGLGTLTAVFHRMKNNLNIRKVTTTQSDPSIHFDFSHALPIHSQTKKTKSGIVEGEEQEERLGKHKEMRKDSYFHRDFAP